MKTFFTRVSKAVIAVIICCLVADTADAQCSGIPFGDTLSPATTYICNSGGSSVILTGGNFMSAGLTYQWQYSPPNVSGAYTNLPGATSFTYVTFQAGSYRRIATCTGSGLSSTSTIANIYVGVNCQDSVWPGDANYDLIANNNDILSIGLGFGLTGSARAITGNTWQPDFAANWSSALPNLINMKNADCNGDGVVDWSDTLAVSANYGLTHLKETTEPAQRGAGLPDLMVDLSGAAMTPGHTYTVPIKFGSSTAPVPKIYGIAGTLKNSGSTLQAAPAMAFSASWLSAMNKLVYLAHPLNANNIDFAIVRNNHHDTAGYGTIGTLTFTVPANATGKMIFGFQNVKLIDTGGHVLTGYNLVSDTAAIHPTGVNNVQAAAALQATIAPNPGHNSSIQIESPATGNIQMSIYDATGRKVYDGTQSVQKGSNKVALSAKELPAGFYTVRLNLANEGTAIILKWIKE